MVQVTQAFPRGASRGLARWIVGSALTSALAASLVLLLACLEAWAMLIPCLPLKADLAEPSGADLLEAAWLAPEERVALPVVAALRAAP